MAHTHLHFLIPLLLLSLLALPCGALAEEAAPRQRRAMSS